MLLRWARKSRETEGRAEQRFGNFAVGSCEELYLPQSLSNELCLAMLTRTSGARSILSDNLKSRPSMSMESDQMSSSCLGRTSPLSQLSNL